MNVSFCFVCICRSVWRYPVPCLDVYYSTCPSLTLYTLVKRMASSVYLALVPLHLLHNLIPFTVKNAGHSGVRTQMRMMITRLAIPVRVGSSLHSSAICLKTGCNIIDIHTKPTIQYPNTHNIFIPLLFLYFRIQTVVSCILNRLQVL